MNILVSINCVTYNHEKYIAKALDGFLMQKTNFKFEILVHDDASEDKTPEIIENYAKRYPDIIKPMFQIENQQSKGIKKISYRFNHGRAIGKYIAYCEGDDYWIDPYKLQKQVDYMENNPDCTMCFHNAEMVNENGTLIGKLVIDKSINDKCFNAGEMAVLGFIPTASTLYLKSVMDNVPQWYFESVVGDYPLQLINSNEGYAYYMNEVMSHYRTSVKGSATDMFNKKNNQEKIKYIEGVINILDNFNKYSDYRYLGEIEKAKIVREVQILELNKEIKKLKQGRYREYYDNLGRIDKIKLYCRCYFPNVYSKLAKLKNVKY